MRHRSRGARLVGSRRRRIIAANIFGRPDEITGVIRAEAATKRRLVTKMAADDRRHAGNSGLVHAGIRSVSRHLAGRGKIRSVGLSRSGRETCPKLLLNVQASEFCSKVSAGAGLLKEACKVVIGAAA